MINMKFSVEEEAGMLNLPLPILRCLDMLSEIDRWEREVKPLIEIYGGNCYKNPKQTDKSG